MTVNLHEAVIRGHDVQSVDFRDDSFVETETIISGVEVMPFSDITFDNFSSGCSTLLVHRAKNLEMKDNLSSESDDAEEDDDAASSCSSSTDFFCASDPDSRNISMTEIDPIGDNSIDSVDSSACFHPPSHNVEEKNEKVCAWNSPVLLESHIHDTIALPDPQEKCSIKGSFAILRFTYLLVTLVIMLADGLQGTHLYVLYEGYGYSVAYLYCLGFATGGLLSPVTGPMVDKIGRKRSAILYCCLEMLINYFEQYPNLYGLILCRMVGGFTTNLLSSVFETWLDTEYRRRGFAKEKYEIIMRDSVIVSNLAAIFSGYLSHILANRYGTVGPFQGAVTCTTIALVVVCFIWTENYGVSEGGAKKNMIEYLKEAVAAFRNDRKMTIVGVLQSLTSGSIQIFVFLWAPTLRHFAQNAPKNTWGLDQHGEPAYGLIFCAFMAAGVLGGLVAPCIRTFMTKILSPLVDDRAPIAVVEIEGEGNVSIRPMAVEFLASSCYFFSALLLFVPSFCGDENALSFTNTLLALVFYEFLIGIFMPCEGVIRSLYFPTDGRASIMTLPRIVVNVAVAVGVVSTNFISLKTAFFAVGCLMTISSALQISLISEREWSSLFSRVELVQTQFKRRARSMSLTVGNVSNMSLLRRMSDISNSSAVKNSSIQTKITFWDAMSSKAKED